MKTGTERKLSEAVLLNQILLSMLTDEQLDRYETIYRAEFQLPAFSFQPQDCSRDQRCHECALSRLGICCGRSSSQSDFQSDTKGGR